MRGRRVCINYCRYISHGGGFHPSLGITQPSIQIYVIVVVPPFRPYRVPAQLLKSRRGLLYRRPPPRKHSMRGLQFTKFHYRNLFALCLAHKERLDRNILASPYPSDFATSQLTIVCCLTEQVFLATTFHQKRHSYRQWYTPSFAATQGRHCFPFFLAWLFRRSEETTPRRLCTCFNPIIGRKKTCEETDRVPFSLTHCCSMRRERDTTRNA